MSFAYNNRFYVSGIKQIQYSSLRKFLKINYSFLYKTKTKETKKEFVFLVRPELIIVYISFSLNKI